MLYHVMRILGKLHWLK